MRHAYGTSNAVAKWQPIRTLALSNPTAALRFSKRLPAPTCLSADTDRSVIAHDFPDICPVPPDRPLALVNRFADLGI